MSLTLTRETLAGVRALFAKVLEVFTGGFAWTAAALTRHTDGVTLPAGTLLVMSEVTRQAKPVKRARLATDQGSAFFSTLTVEKGHLFQVGNPVVVNDAAGTAAKNIRSIAVGAVNDVITIASAGWGGGGFATGVVIVEVGSSNATGPVLQFVGTANAIALYPSTIEAGASVAALRRGTVYANRIQPVIELDDLPVTIQLSTSS